MKKDTADKLALAIAREILQTNPNGIIHSADYGDKAAGRVADFIKELSKRLQEDVGSVQTGSSD